MLILCILASSMHKKPGGCVWEGGGIPEADYIIILLARMFVCLFVC